MSPYLQIFSRQKSLNSRYFLVFIRTGLGQLLLHFDGSQSEVEAR